MDIFKENREFWIYIVGILFLFFILLWAGFYFLDGERSLFGRGGESSEVPATFESPPAFTIDTTDDYQAEFSTNYGNFKVDLFESGAPNNVNNFVFLAQRNYYDELKMFRIVEDLLIQGGSRAVLDDDPDNDSMGNPGYTINDEINWDSLDFPKSKRDELSIEGFSSDPDVASKRMEKYSLVMANAKGATNSAGSQYFFVIGDDADPRLEYLRGRHTVIGEVVEGFEVLDKIREEIESIEVEGDQYPRPSSDVIVTSVKIYTL